MIDERVPAPQLTKARSRYIPLLLIAITLLAYWPLLTGDFTLWDDQETIAKNHWLNPPSFGHFLDFWNPRHPFLDIWIPMTYTVWSGLAAIGYVPTADPESSTALNPWIFHGANVAVHVLSVLLVYSILRRLVGRAWPAAAGAALFALHPVQVEPIGWLSGMKDVLCGCFSLLAIDQYIAFVKSRSDEIAEVSDITEGVSWAMPAASSSRSAPGFGMRAALPFVVATLACALAMLSKPAGVVLPGAVLAIDWVLLRRRLKPALLLLWPWLIFSILIAAEGRYAQPPKENIYITPLIYRPLIATDALAFYLYKLFFPLRLGIVYDREPYHALTQHWPYYTWILPAAVGAMIWIWRRRFPWLLAGAGVSCAAVFPVLGLVPFDFQGMSTVADHYLYLAMLGPAIVAAFLLRNARGRGTVLASVVILAALGTRAWFQTWTWQSSISLFNNAIAVNPGECVGYNNLASAYMKRAEYDKAIAVYEKGLLSVPKCLILHLNAAPALANAGRLDEAEWHLHVIEPFAVGAMKETIQERLTTLAQMRKERDENRAKAGAHKPQISG